MKKIKYLAVMALMAGLFAFADTAHARQNTIYIQNTSDTYAILNVTVSGVDVETYTQGLMISPKSEGAMLKPAQANVDLDFYLDMESLHFVFKNVPLGKADSLAIIVWPDLTPEMELSADGRVIKSVQGQSATYGPGEELGD